MDPTAAVPLETSLTIMDLWLPTVLATVAVFFASSIAWMALPHHKADIKKLPDEAAVLEDVKKHAIPPGLYMWPNCADGAEMKAEDFKKRFNDGPWGMMTIPAGKPNFLRNLVLVGLSYLVISIFVAYLTSEARYAGQSFLEVFQVSGSAALLGYALGQIPGGVFLMRPLRFFITDFIDCVVFALITGAIFAAMWPAS